MGADETGVGDYLSPLVAAAVFVPHQNVKKLIAMGITDSKKITDKKIMELAKKVQRLVIFSIKHLTQSGYNKLNTTFNAHELKMFLHLANINNIENKVNDIDLIIIDKFANQDSIKMYVNNLLSKNFDFKPINNKIKLIKKGEMEHVAVATASILARNKLLSLMAEQNKKWNDVFPLGTNQIVENFTINFVKKHGQNKLGEIAKLKFKTTKKLFG